MTDAERDSIRAHLRDHPEDRAAIQRQMADGAAGYDDVDLTGEVGGGAPMWPAGAPVAHRDRAAILVLMVGLLVALLVIALGGAR